MTTEARSIVPGASIFFAHRDCSFFFIEEGIGAMYGLKITATVLSASQKYRLFEKKIDLTDNLVGNGSTEREQTIIAQVKQS